MFYIAPALFLIFGLKIYHVSLGQIIAIAAPYVLSTFFIIDYFYGRTRQPLFSEIYESIQAIFLIPAVISVFLNPTKPAFKVTPKGQLQQNESLNALATVFVILIIICLLALMAAVLRWIELPTQRDTILVTGIWCCYNLFLTIISLGAFWERRQVRSSYRVNVQEPINVYFPRLKLGIDCMTADIALYGLGFSAKLPHRPLAKERVSIKVALSNGGSHTFDAQLQRIRATGEEYMCGAKFLLDEKSFPIAVSYVYGDSGRWQKLWMEESTNPGTLRMLTKFFMLGLKGVFVSAVLVIGKLRSVAYFGYQWAASSWKARTEAAR